MFFRLFLNSIEAAESQQAAEQYVKYKCQTETCKQAAAEELCNDICGGKWKYGISADGKVFK